MWIIKTLKTYVLEILPFSLCIELTKFKYKYDCDMLRTYVGYGYSTTKPCYLHQLIDTKSIICEELYINVLCFCLPVSMIDCSN